MTLLHIEYTSFMSCGCREEDFFMYFHYKSMADNNMPGARPVWTPRAPLAGFLKRSTIHCSTQNMKALSHDCGFGEEDFFFFFTNCKLVYESY